MCVLGSLPCSSEEHFSTVSSQTITTTFAPSLYAVFFLTLLVVCGCESYMYFFSMTFFRLLIFDADSIDPCLKCSLHQKTTSSYPTVRVETRHLFKRENVQIDDTFLPWIKGKIVQDTENDAMWIDLEGQNSLSFLCQALMPVTKTSCWDVWLGQKG